MTSQPAKGTMICVGCYGWFSGEWVKSGLKITKLESMASLGYLQVVCYVTSLNNTKRKGRNRDNGVLLVLKLVLVGCPLFYLKRSSY